MIVALYVVVLGFLGKGLFVLTLLGFWFVFLPIWLLAISAVLSAISIVHDKHISLNVILVLYSIGVVTIPLAMSLIYSQPALFWGQ